MAAGPLKFTIHIPCEIFEQRKLTKPPKFNGAGFTASLFGNNDLGDMFFGRIFIVIIVAINECNDVGILFNCT